MCIGGAEIAYFYLFGGIGTGKPMTANMVIPTVVSGTIVITVVAAYFVFGETLALTQLTGVACIILLGCCGYALARDTPWPDRRAAHRIPCDARPGSCHAAKAAAQSSPMARQAGTLRQSASRVTIPYATAIGRAWAWVNSRPPVP